jgi:2-dehydropantoate 2-reductase
VKLVVVGAGATGAFIGARLARAGADVTLVARGPHLAAMRRRGVEIRGDGDGFVAHPPCTDDLSVVAGADAVFLTLKAHGLTEMAPRLGPLLGPDTAVVTAQNGIPWWYFERHGGPLEGTRLRTVDPGGIIAAHLDARRVVGCVVYPATTIVAPGVVQHIEGNRFSLGELDGTTTERVRGIAAALIQGGLKAPIRPRIRDEIWLKLLGNVCFNPVSALTRATMVEIATDPEMRPVARAIMEEAEAVARALGIELPIGVEQRLAGAEKVGSHKTSMLQDVESGRPLEIEALVGAVLEIAGLLELSLPHLRTVYACARLLDRHLRAGAR